VAVLAIATMPLTPPAAQPAAAQPAAATQTESKFPVVAATFDVLMDQFYKPLQPRPLLTAGWDAARIAAQRASAPVMPALMPLPEGRAAALTEFRAQYRAYEATLSGSFSPLMLAFVAANGMAASLNEAHTS